jgi:hypothetical protein
MANAGGNQDQVAGLAEIAFGPDLDLDLPHGNDDEFIAAMHEVCPDLPGRIDIGVKCETREIRTNGVWSNRDAIGM